MNSSRRNLLLLALLSPWAGLVSAAANKPTNTPAKRKVKMVTLHTNFGPITLELDAKAAPETVANFIQYAKDGHYDGTIFHRVIDGFMIQGGGFTADMDQKPTRATIQNEAQNGLKNVAYSVAMARTPDPHSASSQFFINIADNAFLDFRAANSQGYGYCVFGKVTEGQDVVDRIRKVRTGSKAGHQDVPVESVIIERAEVTEG
jgi:peptidyl-prolyl cis-trans isomerase B (cyclophilin B)